MLPTVRWRLAVAGAVGVVAASVTVGCSASRDPSPGSSGSATDASSLRSTPSPAIPPGIGLDHTLCSLLTSSDVRDALGLAGSSLGSTAVFRMRQPAEDGCVMGFKAVSVGLSVTIDPVDNSDVIVRAALDRDAHPQQVSSIGRGAIITSRSGLAVVSGDHLIDVSVDPNNAGEPRPAQAKIEAMLRKAVAVYPRLVRLPRIATQTWCNPGDSVVSSILGAPGQIQRGAIFGGFKTCGWATKTKNVDVTMQRRPDAVTFVQQTMHGKSYRDTIIATSPTAASNLAYLVVDDTHYMMIGTGINQNPTTQDLYALFAALRDALR
jgi:hypothetical protein